MSPDFTIVLEVEAIVINRDGRGRAYHNSFDELLRPSVNHEHVYLSVCHSKGCGLGYGSLLQVLP